jgi:hypothetical protein
MTTEKKRLYSIVVYSSLFAIPLSAIGLYAFYASAYIKPYLIFAYTFHLLAVFLIIFKRNSLLWYFSIILLTAFSSLTIGFALNTGALLILAFGKYVPANWILIGTFAYFALCCISPLKYYHDDYHKTEKKRLKSFDFEKGTYDITTPTLIRSDAFADYYETTFYAKVNRGIITFYLLFPISGGAIAIVAGKISKSLQLGIGIGAAILSTLFFIHCILPGVFNVWQVRQLEKKCGKKIMIYWGDSEE